MQLGGYATTDMHVSMIDKCSCKDRKILIRQVVTVFAAPCLAACRTPSGAHSLHATVASYASGRGLT